jgi:hypothetical protein
LKANDDSETEAQGDDTAADSKSFIVARIQNAALLSCRPRIQIAQQHSDGSTPVRFLLVAYATVVILVTTYSWNILLLALIAARRANPGKRGLKVASPAINPY